MGGSGKSGPEEEISHTYCDNCLRELIDRSQEEDQPAEFCLDRES